MNERFLGGDGEPISFFREKRENKTHTHIHTYTHIHTHYTRVLLLDLDFCFQIILRERREEKVNWIYKKKKRKKVVCMLAKKGKSSPQVSRFVPTAVL